ncbi:MAG: carbonic anhydrase [Streptosporangiaceae bacterium]|jgi:carbonic anhydrase
MSPSEPPRPPVSRRGFMSAAGTGIVATGLAGSGLARAGAARPDAYPASQTEALRLLMQGNERWVRGRPRHPHQSVAWRHHVAGHQEPFATVVSCIDSRVPPELVFDRGLGDLFVIRTGAQALDELVVLGSVEFGPDGYPSARLIFVLGHARCGAVQGAIASIQSGQRAPGHIQAVVNALRPAYHVAIRQSGDLVDNMVRAQTKLTVQRLKKDPLLRKLIVTDGLMIVGGHYDLDTGVVQIIA